MIWRIPRCYRARQMPFTISHAAAAWPVHALTGKRLPVAALMIGSMTPDFVFYLPQMLEYDRSHSVSGLFTLCLPMGLLIWLFYLRVLERPTLSWLPEAWRTRMAPTGPLSSSVLVTGAVGVLLGSFTHLAWDSFTHASTPVVDAFPVFREELPVAGSLSLPIYFLLQLLSSVVGLVVLAIWALRVPRQQPLPEKQLVPAALPAPTHRDRWRTVAGIAVLALVVALLNRLRYGDIGPNGNVFVLLVGAMAGGALGWTLAAVMVRIRSAQFASTAGV